MPRSACDADAIVVGAAVAGSAVANALGQMGIRTLVLEKGPERDNSTRGDILHPPTLAFLDRWGVLADLHADGALPITKIAVSHRDLGRLATYDIPSRGEGPAGRSIAVPHDRIEAVMKSAAERWPSVRVERGRVVGVVRQGGRIGGVRATTDEGERTFLAPLVVGCDGSQSLVRREAGIPVDRHPYDHDFLYIAADGPTDPPAAMHFHLDDRGIVLVASRPRERMRIAIYFEKGTRGDLLKRPDPALHEYVEDRVPSLANARFGRANAYVYAITRQVAERFSLPGVALVGDSAHTTHPSGATGMNLAVSGAARLAEMAGPVLEQGISAEAGLAALDAAIERYEADRRPWAAAAVAQNDVQAHRIWIGDVYKDPYAYAKAVDPAAGWGVGGAGWGENPAGLPELVSTASSPGGEGRR